MNTQYSALVEAPAKDPFPNPTGSAPHILIVDGDFFLRQLEAEALRCAGYEVDDVVAGAAWNALQRTDYDLLVTENEMSGITGVELVKLVKSAQMPLPVIMTTGSLANWESVPDPYLNRVTVMFKPYTITEFLALVKNVIRETNPAGEEFALPDWQSRQPAFGMRL